jgi:hypothetical protein
MHRVASKPAFGGEVGGGHVNQPQIEAEVYEGSSCPAPMCAGLFYASCRRLMSGPGKNAQFLRSRSWHTDDRGRACHDRDPPTEGRSRPNRHRKESRPKGSGLYSAKLRSAARSVILDYEHGGVHCPGADRFKDFWREYASRSKKMALPKQAGPVWMEASPEGERPRLVLRGRPKVRSSHGLLGGDPWLGAYLFQVNATARIIVATERILAVIQ